MPFLVLLSTWLAGCGQRAQLTPHLDGFEVGNGGVIMLCEEPTSKTKSYELLDFYRAKLKFQNTTAYRPDFGSTKKTVTEKVLFALTRLRRLDPARATVYQNGARTFFDRV